MSYYGERGLLRRVDGARDADSVEAGVRAATRVKRDTRSTMRRLPLIALLALVAWPQAAAAELKVANAVEITRMDGTAVQVAQNLRVWCGRWDRDVPARSLHIRAGARSGPFWQLDAVVADVRRDPVVRFPHSFVFDKPTGAELFAVDRENELSSCGGGGERPHHLRRGPLRPPARRPVPRETRCWGASSSAARR